MGFFELQSILTSIRGPSVGTVLMKYGNSCVLLSLVAVAKGDTSGILWAVAKSLSSTATVLEVPPTSPVHNQNSHKLQNIVIK